MSALRRHIWLGAIVVGVVFVVSGIVMITQATAARADIREGLEAEQITTGGDGELFGVAKGTPVLDPASAWAQAETIRYHSLGGEPQVVDGKIVGGIPYAGMEREDPQRATYLNGVTLRTALTLAYMSFKVTDLIMGLGAIFIVLGVSMAGLVGPALYWARGTAPATQARAATAGQSVMASRS